MTRLPDWRARLVDYLAGWQDVPFAYGTADCWIFALGAAEVQTGVDHIGAVRGYTDTSFQAADFARVAGDEALAAQIRTLTAVLNSENYLENSRFSDGLTGWTPSDASATSVVDQDDASADPIIANAPTTHYAWITGNASASRSIRQDFAVEWTDGEVFQWRLYGAASVNRSSVSRS